MKHRKKGEEKPEEEGLRAQLKLENDIVEHSAAVLTCATEAAGEFVGVCDRHLEDLEVDLPYLRVAMEIWAQHPELAQPLKHSMQQLLQVLTSQYKALTDLKLEFQRLADDPAPHVHLEPVERYHQLIRARLIT
jgi:hypothetical protein